MDNESREEPEYLEQASDLLTAPEGTRKYVDIIGDEKLDTSAAANPGSDFNRNF